MNNQESNIKIKEILEMKNKIEDKLRFIEENFENLDESQLDDMLKLSNSLEENLYPEIEEIKAEFEKNKEEFLNNAHNFKK